MRYLVLVFALLVLMAVACKSGPPANTDYLNSRAWCEWQADEQSLEDYNRAIFVRACTGQPNPNY